MPTFAEQTSDGFHGELQIFMHKNPTNQPYTVIVRSFFIHIYVHQVFEEGSTA